MQLIEAFRLRTEGNKVNGHTEILYNELWLILRRYRRICPDEMRVRIENFREITRFQLNFKWDAS